MNKAVLFDLDGVLVEMVGWHEKAFLKAMKDCGYNISKETHRQIYNGLPTAKKIDLFESKFGAPISAEEKQLIKDLKAEYTQKYVKENIKPNEETIKAVKLLRANNYKVACCSNAQYESVKEILTAAGLIELMDEVIGNDSGFAPKPEPDIYLEAMKRFDVETVNTYIVEDSPVGLEAAKKTRSNVIKVDGPHEVTTNLFVQLNLV